MCQSINFCAISRMVSILFKCKYHIFRKLCDFHCFPELYRLCQKLWCSLYWAIITYLQNKNSLDLKNCIQDYLKECTHISHLKISICFVSQTRHSLDYYPTTLDWFLIIFIEWPHNSLIIKIATLTRRYSVEPLCLYQRYFHYVSMNLH